MNYVEFDAFASQQTHILSAHPLAYGKMIEKKDKKHFVRKKEKKRE